MSDHYNLVKVMARGIKQVDDKLLNTKKRNRIVQTTNILQQFFIVPFIFVSLRNMVSEKKTLLTIKENNFYRMNMFVTIIV